MIVANLFSILNQEDNFYVSIIKRNGESTELKTDFDNLLLRYALATVTNMSTLSTTLHITIEVI